MTSTRLPRAIPLGLAATLIALSLGAAHAPTASAFPDPDCSNPSITVAAPPLRVGGEVSGSFGSCSGFPPPDMSLQWFRCPTAADTPSCVAVSSAGQPPMDYTAVQADIGSFLMLKQYASNLAGSEDHAVFTSRVRGHPPTLTNFSASPNPVLVNHAVTFTASASDPDGQGLTYKWDFDSNGSADASTQSPSVSHTFHTTGTKTVTVRVQDTDGDQSGTVSHKVTVHGPPTASFVFTPDSPQSGQDVTFTSTSTDPDGDPLAYAWDLDGDGAFDDGNTSVVHFTYGHAGSYTASLKVASVDGTSTVFRTVDVVAPPAPPPTGGKKHRLKLLRPFPKVAIAGFFTARGVRLTLLGVRAPKGSTVMVRCKGHGCPRRTTRKHVGRKRALVFHSFRRRFRAGTVIAIYVWKKNRIGKYTRILIRANSKPARRDRCLDPVKLKPRRCS